MPAQTYPGVYVQEVPSGARTITGVSTSTALFIGASKKGPINKPVLCFNYSNFRNEFGDDPGAGQLANYVRLFFLNGGSLCWVMRIATGASPSSVILANEAGADTLELTAKNAGMGGDSIRAKVSYNSAQPEATFSLDLFRWEFDGGGNKIIKDPESWPGLSMDPASPTYAADFITQNSKLVNARNIISGPGARGVSISGRAVADAGGGSGFRDAWRNILGSTVQSNTFKISVGGRIYVHINLQGFAVTNVQAALAGFIAGAINTAYAAKGIPGVNVTVSFAGVATARRLKIESTVAGEDVFIRPGITVPGAIPATDLSVPLMLGTEQGGVEVSAYADRRPAPNGVTVKANDTVTLFTALDVLVQSGFAGVTLESLLAGVLTPQPVSVQPPVTPNVQTTAAGDLFTKDAFVTSRNGNSDGIREKLRIIAQVINSFTPPAGHTWPWTAEVWGYRLAILPKDGLSDDFFTAGTAIAVLPASLTSNLKYYSLGASSIVGMQKPGTTTASDGTQPDAAAYDLAYERVDKEVDIFNLLVLPPVEAPVISVDQLYANASVFCQQRRAFLLMDSPSSWTDATTAMNGVAAARTSLVKDYSAIFYPDITVRQNNGLNKDIGPAGAVAGLFARTDAARGVWKAPAGIEADLRGITGLKYRFSDNENGVLNPKAINTLRVFPSGIVNWGARTNFGDDSTPHDYKYIPVRRTALFIEESLYRGLKWAVFEPNDEPLWAEIRTSVGAFMYNLYRQGAFKGAKNDSYFVKCDEETTNQNDVNLGIVNVWVGFAPLKPAEFVILYLQQMTGQIEV